MQRDSIEINSERENDLGTNELLDGVRRGDSGAIAQFVMYYHKSIQGAVHNVITDPDIAREVTSDTLKTVVKQLQSGVHTGDFEPWLMWMARNNAMMSVRLDRATVSPKPAPARYEDVPPEPAARYTAVPPEPAPTRYTTAPPEPAPTRYTAAPPEPAPTRYTAVPPEPAPTRYTAAPPKPASTRYTAAPPPLPVDTPEVLSFAPEEQQADAPKRPKEHPPQNRGLHVGIQKRDFRYMDTLIIILMVLVIIFLLWVIIGLLAKLNIFSIPDLGYRWFNSHLFRLF